MTNHYTKLHPAHDPGRAANMLVCQQVDQWIVYEVTNTMELPRQIAGEGDEGIYTEIKDSIYTTALRSFRSELELADLQGYPHAECPYIGSAGPLRLPHWE